MARITRVKAAQQRYATKPVLNEDGTQKITPVMKGGVQKTTKHGKPIVLRVTQRDLTAPLAEYTCDHCSKPIKIGTPYKHVTPKSGPYGGHQRNRHEACPTWQPWDLSSAWWARIAQVVDGFDLGTPESPDEVLSVLSDFAEEIRGLAEESQEAADNVEEGFGHETSTSQEAAERADALNGWADEIENLDVPDLPEPEDEDCDACSGVGTTPHPDSEEPILCDECEGNGTITSDDPSDEQMDEWRNEVESACEIVNESPV